MTSNRQDRTIEMKHSCDILLFGVPSIPSIATEIPLTSKLNRLVEGLIGENIYWKIMNTEMN